MAQSQTRTISITSGKGGVGKSTLVSNTAYYLSSLGKKVLIFDGDLGMANIDIMYGVKTQHTILDVLKGTKTLSEIIVEISRNIWLIPGGSGIRDFNQLTSFERRALLDSVSQFPYQFDYLLIDTSPGIGDNTLYLNAAVQTPIVVITPDPASFTDSYALIKVLNQVHRVDEFSIVCNMVENAKDGMIYFNKFSDVTCKFLNGVSLKFLGSVPLDHELRQANMKQRLIMRQSANAESSQAIRAMCLNLEGTSQPQLSHGGLQFFWEQLIGVA